MIYMIYVMVVNFDYRDWSSLMFEYYQ